jgi:hypothetical protein
MLSLASSRTSVTMSSAKSSVMSLPLGEFDVEENPTSLQAARGSKSANAIVDATAKVRVVSHDHGLSLTSMSDTMLDGHLAHSQGHRVECERQGQAHPKAPADQRQPPIPSG